VAHDQPSCGPQPAFHAGERALQARAGMLERMDELGPRVVRDFMPDQHRELFEELPMLFVGSLDAQGRPWASLLTGPPGFVRSPDPRTLQIHGALDPADPLRERARRGAALGVLGIQLETRRRNRMNGLVRASEPALLEVQVAQSFGNCPKYIHRRAPAFSAQPGPVRFSTVRAEGALLSSAAQAIVQGADTFFIASASSPAPRVGQHAEGVDVSHRGGAPGFVALGRDGARSLLTAPDYQGNFFFNTLGNLVLYPRAGLLFLDFERGALLSLSVDAEIISEGSALSAFPGAQRLTRFRVSEGLLAEDAIAMRFPAL
jgi:predicted pyridoxine 5'-phosphate oxidase superfamily flavin-nucleotide-binding protein